MQSSEEQSSSNLPFALLKPKHLPPRLSKLKILPEPTAQDVLNVLRRPAHQSNDPMALDFETRGFPLEQGSAVVGVGLSDSRGSWYFNLQGVSGERIYRLIVQELDSSRIPLIAHNVNFDAMWIVRDHGVWLNWIGCTYATYRLTATEGWPGQKWGLKDAQVDLMGWTEKGDVALDQWLVDNGYGEAVKDSKTGKIKLRPHKWEMWRTPVEILGHYCCLDADSTYQFWTGILLPVLKRFKALYIYCTNWYPKYERILIEQSLSGIKVDLERLAAYEVQLNADLSRARSAIFEHPQLRPWFDRINQEALAEVMEAEPPKFNKAKPLPPEPPQFTKSGATSKNWLKYHENIKAGLYEPKPNLNWPKWAAKLEALKGVEQFNLNSGDQKKRLFYEYLYPTSHLSELKRTQGNRETVEPVFKLITPDRPNGVLLPLTKSGGVPANRVALKQMKDIGKVFLDYQELIKESQFVEGLKDNHKNGVLHPQFRVPGTLSGRLSGGGGRSGKDKKGFNFQQVPKSPGFLRCFVPRPGKTFVDVDHTSLEDVVLAELSKDPALWSFYGPESKPNDPYLFVGAGLPGEIGRAIRQYGYDPLNPVPSIIALTKEKCKKERGVAKIIKLGGNYKMGPAKMQRTLSLEGVEVTFEESQAMHRAFWKLYQGVKDYEYNQLIPQYEDNSSDGGSGWVLNGIGRPIGIFEDYRGDIVNRVVQSTGHDIHIRYALIIEEVMRAENIKFSWIITDLHDQSILEVDIKDAERVKDLLNGECYVRLNRVIAGAIPLKGDAQIVKDLSYAKCSKEDIRQFLKDIGIVEEEDNE